MDRFLHGTIESALGQGYLALEEFEPAVQHLQRPVIWGKHHRDAPGAWGKH